MSQSPAAERTGPLLGILADRPVMTGILGAMSIAFSGILVRLANVEPATAAIFRCAYALPALAAIAYLERRAYGPRPAAQVRVAMLAGVFLALDLVVWHHTIGLVGAGLATVLGNTRS
jgi:drug/metabolite transporter (DMT)-like permease